MSSTPTVGDWNRRTRSPSWQGKLVEPKKPIVFYIDDNFPELWKKYIHLAVEDWNLAFEKIGFKKAIIAKDFPKDDPEFDPDNLKYSCVRYAPTWMANAMGPSWTDPRTGEIINASVYIYHNLISLLYNCVLSTPQAADRTYGIKFFRKRSWVMPSATRAATRWDTASVSCIIWLPRLLTRWKNSEIPSSRKNTGRQLPSWTTPASITWHKPGDKERGVKLTPRFWVNTIIS